MALLIGTAGFFLIGHGRVRGNISYANFQALQEWSKGMYACIVLCAMMDKEIHGCIDLFHDGRHN